MSKRQKLSDERGGALEEEATKPEDSGKVIHLQDLPDEILLQILQHLPHKNLAKSVARVNRHLNYLALDPSLWTDLKILRFDSTDYAGRLISSLRWSQLRQLTMRPWISTNLDTNSLSILALRTCPRLKTLSISRGQPLSSDLFEAIGESPSLRHLRLDNMSLGGHGKALMSRSEGLRCLTQIDLRSMISVTDEALRSVAHYCTGLRNFRCNFQSASKSPSRIAVRNFMEKRACSIKDLCVDIHWLQYQEFFDAIVLCDKLEVVNLYQASPLQLSSMKAMSHHRKLLKTLKIRRPELLRSEDFVSAFGETKWTSLTTLHLEHCVHFDDEALRAVTSACPRLLHLGLAYCDSMTNFGFNSAMAKGVCKKIRSLSMCQVSVLSEEALQGVAQLLPELTVLVLTLCRGICCDRTRLLEIVGVVRPRFQLIYRQSK